MAETVPLVHPDLPDAVFNCPAEAVDAWADRGWKPQTKAAAKAQKEG